MDSVSDRLTSQRRSEGELNAATVEFPRGSWSCSGSDLLNQKPSHDTTFLGTIFKENEEDRGSWDGGADTSWNGKGTEF